MTRTAKPYAERVAAEASRATRVLSDEDLARFGELIAPHFDAIARIFAPGWRLTILARRETDGVFAVNTNDQLGPAIAALRRADRREKRA